MSGPLYMTIKGVHQGLITAGALNKLSVGGAAQEHHEDQFLIQAMAHNMFSNASNRSNYKRHEVLIITKAVDKSTPLIGNAFSSGETLVQCRIDWYRTAGEGVQEHYYTTELEDAVIVGVQALVADSMDPKNAYLMHRERVHFAYRNIRWSHEIAATFGSDGWNKR